MRHLGSRSGTLIGIATKKRDPDLVDASFARQPMSAALRHWKGALRLPPIIRTPFWLIPVVCAMARDRIRHDIRKAISLTVISKILAANAAGDRERELDGDTKLRMADRAVALSPS
jgi:hypothetical protein